MHKSVRPLRKRLAHFEIGLSDSREGEKIVSLREALFCLLPAHQAGLHSSDLELADWKKQNSSRQGDVSMSRNGKMGDVEG